MRLVAVELRLTTALAAWPAAMVPLVGATVSQADVFTHDQFKLDALLFVSRIVKDGLAKGPPTSPDANNPVPGDTPRESGASASINGCPAGVPQPVQRS